MKTQVTKDIYDFGTYFNKGRWATYANQIEEVMKCSPKSILEVGPGDKVFCRYILNNTKVDYKSLDIAADLCPDIIGSVHDIPVEDKVFDVVCAFEVLEHLPFDKFEKALKEMRRVSKKFVIVSLPHFGRHFYFDIRVPFFASVRWQYKLDWLKKEHEFDGQHYWEIGKRGYSLSLIKKKMESCGFRVVKDYVCFESPYHHFFILEK